MSSLGKKYIMAVTGLVLVGFVVGHMLGNLQMFLHRDWINEYAYKLQHLPYGLLWIVRGVLLACVVAHVVTAVLLVLENRRARPEGYAYKAKLQASFASKTMKYTGLVLLAFIVFHLMHFTVKNVYPEYGEWHTQLEGVGTMHHVYAKVGAEPIHDVYRMVAVGFSPAHWYVSVFYLVAMALLCLHLMHGVSSMFQSLGLRNALWRVRLDTVALGVALVVFVGFASLPVAGLAGLYDLSYVESGVAALMTGR